SRATPPRRSPTRAARRGSPATRVAPSAPSRPAPTVGQSSHGPGRSSPEPSTRSVSGDAVAPTRVVVATAPVRVCDIGGWTDTWFARHGHVCSIAVRPGVTVRATAYPRATRPRTLVVNAVDFRERLVLCPGSAVPERHRLLAAGP